MDKEKRKYTVRRVDDETKQPEPQEPMPEIPDMPMLEIGTSAALLAFFVLVCASAFGVFLVGRMTGGHGMGTIIGCLLMLIVLIGAIAGIFVTTLGKFKRAGSKGKLAFVLVLYVAAVVIGVAVGRYMP